MSRRGSRQKVQIDVHYKFLEAYRSAKIEDESINYAFSIYLGEAVDSFTGNTFLPFIVDVETKPEGVLFKIKGEVFITGPKEAVKRLVISKDNEPPGVWSQVYEETLKILSALADHIQVPTPHNQLKNA